MFIHFFKGQTPHLLHGPLMRVREQPDPSAFGPREVFEAEPVNRSKNEHQPRGRSLIQQKWQV